ncbi:MAG TPA: hypothetical protein VFE46_08190 [Pirellulales bacterium]|jgi:hypothetical protein|nr:hypothetical protein [Pirellulales bacterium]
MSYDDTKVKINERSDGFEVYGKKFSHPPRNNPQHFPQRKSALAQAKQYGAELLANLERLKGQSLTKREEITGHLDAAPDEQPLSQRVREDVQLIEPAQPDPDQNPWTARLDELKSQCPLAPSEQAQLARRIKLAERWAELWQRKHDVERADEAHKQQIKKMRNHAASAYDEARNDSDATAEEVRERKRQLDLTETCQPEEYWKVNQ